MNRRNFLVGSAVLAAYALCKPRSLAWSAPSSVNASIRIGSRKRPINQSVMGVGLMYPPFDSLTDYLKAFSKSSIRVWSHASAEWWAQFEAALIQIKPTKILAFNNELSRHSEKVFYRSGTDNNLYVSQQVEQVLLQIQFAVDRLTSIDAMPAEGLFWEIWNEPELPKNGSWKVRDLACYANDIALAVRQRSIPVKILVPLSMYDHGWSDELCSRLDPKLVDGLVNHYYYSRWNNLKAPQDRFLARASGGPILKKLIGQDQLLIEKYGQGRWSLHCSEWNVHPADYSPPFYTSRDMAVAMYAFDALKIYLESDLASAQFFLLTNRNQHFSAITVKNDTSNVVHPVGALFRLMHQHLHGELLETIVTSDGYRRQARNEIGAIKIPYVSALAARKTDGGTALFIANKHRSLGAKVVLNGFSLPASAEVDLLVGYGEMKDIARVSRIRLAVEGEKIMIPAGSIVVVQI